jgi:2-polyprenyl-3-methyl-5-hydroxy-6-metoxy-1,4-benzoquinol methylase
MDVRRWRSQQRRLRDAVRVQRRTPDGRGAVAPPSLTAPIDLQAPELLRGPIVSRRGAPGQVIVETKKLLRRLLAPFLIEPQARFNQEVVATLASQREELSELTQLLAERAQSAPGSVAAATSVEIDYLGFEERFRGSSDAIESRQSEYLDYFFGRGEILDIGCGRGEFLALLREHGTSARGVDMDEDMVARCREQGLAAECAEAVEFLEGEPDGSFGGVFMSQVVEHLPTGHLVALLDAIARKTASGAVLIIETINPESLPVLMRWFWLDPTHVRLVHPETLQYFMEQAGFATKSVQFRRPVPAEDRLPELELASVPPGELATYNEAVARFNAQLFGPLDYFVVGQSDA